MNSYEILRQYMAGALSGSSCIVELEKLITQSGGLLELQEATRARYARGFLYRVSQYRCGEASAQDLCLNLRDLLIILGRLRVSQKLFDFVREYGGDYDLVCESNLAVSCNLCSPVWIENPRFIQDVYHLKPYTNWEAEPTSVGDALLGNYTKFIYYKSFEQKLAVHTALNLPKGHMLLVSQPTGGGKSLVTQMLAASVDGLTVVIVPTVALALDQYYAAMSNLKDSEGVYCYRGDQTAEDRVALIKAVRNKKAKLLFTSPEAIFKNSELFGLLETAASDRYLAHIVVDEAHVVTDWGVFFRPDFQIFSVVLRKWRKNSGYHIRTYLLSATLSDDVVDTLFSLFGEDGRNAQLRCDVLRLEPRFYFYPAKTKQEQDDKTLEAIKLLPKPMVVYVFEPWEATDLQKKLRELGYVNIPTFTGKTKDVDRDTILKAWKNNEYDIILATSAFGIGVDKPDVRTIIHACVPENLSRFYQEVGRGGRDGLPSISLFLPYTSYRDGEGDLARSLGLVNKRVLRVESIMNRWFGMLRSDKAYINGDTVVLDSSATPPTMTEEEAEYAGNRNITWNINLLLLLHRIGFISLEDAFFKQENNSYFMTLKVLKPDILGNANRLIAALEKPRRLELDMQLAGYKAIKSLVQRPTVGCWSRALKNLFPLAKEICNGCPVHPEGNIAIDDIYRLRCDPEIQLMPMPVTGQLERQMGTYLKLVIRRVSDSYFDLVDIKLAADKAAKGSIGVLVLPKRLCGDIAFPGLTLTYEEFYFTAVHAPYLFANGVLCVFCYDSGENYSLFRNLERLDAFQYRQLLYCSESMLVPSTGKAVRESLDGYSIMASDL